METGPSSRKSPSSRKVRKLQSVVVTSPAPAMRAQASAAQRQTDQKNRMSVINSTVREIKLQKPPSRDDFGRLTNTTYPQIRLKLPLSPRPENTGAALISPWANRTQNSTYTGSHDRRSTVVLHQSNVALSQPMDTLSYARNSVLTGSQNETVKAFALSNRNAGLK